MNSTPFLTRSSTLTLLLAAALTLRCASGGETRTGQVPTASASVAGAGSSAPAASSAAAAASSAAVMPSATVPGLPPAPGAADVPVPAGAAGNLTVLDWAGFTGAVSYTFDDNTRSQVQHFDRLMALAVPFTFYMQTNQGSAANEIWRSAIAAGHELGNHTHSHMQEDADGSDTDAATQFLESTFGIKVWTMAAPFGNRSYGPLAQTRFMINRGVNPGLIAAAGTHDPYNLPCSLPDEGASTADMNALVDTAQAEAKWRVILVHGFTGDGAAYQPVGIDEFVASVEHAKSLGNVWIDSVVNIGAYWLGQRALAAATPVTAGDSTTWTWTLPAHFPPGKHLRVKVDGGTLKQGDQALPWDARGYYQVALDAGSLTLTP
jgi:peptidoglycan/xylan/chitin deacetylase (PgdA/CDA1 family)